MRWLSLLVCACTSSAGGVAPDAGGPADDAAPALRGTSILVPMAFEGGGSALAVLTLETDGRLVDGGARLETPRNAAVISFRADGREALALYGRGPTEKGALVLALDGSSAEIAQHLVIEGDHAPVDVVYAADGEAVVGMRGPDNDHLLTLERGDDGWAMGPAVPCGGSPLRMYDLGRPGELLLLRVDLVGSEGSQVLPVARQGDGGWEISGAGPDFPAEHITDLAVSADGTEAFTIRFDPESTDEVNPSGLIVTISVDPETGDWSVSGEPAALTDAAGQIALAREGDVMVMNDPVTELDPTGTVPITTAYELETAEVDASGPSQIAGPRTSLPPELISGMEFGPGGALVLAQGHSVHSFRRAAPGSAEWTEVNAVTLEGSPTAIAIGP